MRNLCVLLILFLCAHIGNCHELECGTLSIPEDSAVVAQLRQIRHSRSLTNFNDTLYFRIQIHIIRNNNHTTSLSIDSLKKDLYDLNMYFAPASICFYQCNDYDYIDNDQYYNFHNSDEEFIRQTYNDPYAVNIYFANQVYIGDNTYAGYSYRPSSSSPNFVIIANENVRKKTLIHEVGHFFNLLHTHDYTNGYEYVNGSNCQTAGDLCCDTPADPKLSNINVNLSCQYTGSTTDPNGEYYTPDTHNIMSYSRKECRDHFTSDQYERIRDAAYLSCRQILLGHCTTLENGSLSYNVNISNDIVVVNNYYIDADSITISACHETMLKKSVTIQKGVIIQP